MPISNLAPRTGGVEQPTARLPVFEPLAEHKTIAMTEISTAGRYTFAGRVSHPDA